jgi:hypothetical protein
MPPRQSGRIRAVATVVAAACLLGADFGRPDPDSFSLGQTTEQEIRERFGEPANRFNGRVGDKPITVLRYQYAEPRSTEILARAMSYTFHEGRLVGYDYSSSFAADRTNFDGAAAKRIRRGQSTRTDVLDLAGKPTPRSAAEPARLRLQLRAQQPGARHPDARYHEPRPGRRLR